MTGLSDVDGPWEVMWLSIIKLGINWSENKGTNMIQGVTGVEQGERKWNRA